MTIVVYLIAMVNAVVSLGVPWIGMVLAYVIAVLAPHNIWWWVFGDLRPFMWVVVPTLAGFCISVVRGKVDFRMLNTRTNRCVMLLWLFFTISFYFGPYVDVVNEYRFYDAPFMFSELQKTYLTYFVAVALFDNTRKLKYASLVILITTLYMTYWANEQYFLLHKYGRMHGPTTLAGQGIYADENNFAVLFVVGFPFIYYCGRYFNKRLVSWATLLIIPWCWHAVFLTASRGALLGIGAVLLIFTLRSRNKVLGGIVIAAFVGAFIWQAGDVMKSRSATITSYETEDSASERIEAWHASSNMMAAHPLTGVGFASFGQAYPDYSSGRPRVAHNTFFQIGGEWGIAAGITYLVLVFSTANRLRRNGTRLARIADPDAETRLHWCLNEACLLALVGFFTCSMFLSLQGYEVFYYLLLLANATLICSGFAAKTTEVKAVRARLPGRPATRQVLDP